MIASGLLVHFASSSHDINYMVAYPLIFGELTSESYTDEAAKDPRIDALRAKITCVEDKRFSVEYHEPSKRSIGNALLVELVRRDVFPRLVQLRVLYDVLVQRDDNRHARDDLKLAG